jgi:regulatory protein
LSDARFAESFVRSRSGRLGSRRIERELRDKGIPDEITQQTIRSSALDDLATARALWERKFGALPTDEKEKARQVRFLQARGFSLSVALKVIKASKTD